MAKQTSSKKALRKKAQRKKAGKRGSPKPDREVVAVDVAQLEVIVDPALRLTWTDRMTISLRADVPIATLSFYSLEPNRLREAARLQASVPHLQEVVDVICRTLDYYPEKASK